MHGLCYHMSQQMRRLGGTGFLSESVVKAMHVVDNSMMSRYACVKNLEDQRQCHARAMWQLCNPNTGDIREQDNLFSARKRAKIASVHRIGRFMQSSSMPIGFIESWSLYSVWDPAILSAVGHPQ
eukprot:5946878-Pleurochrysis_carterae.AAC.1